MSGFLASYLEKARNLLDEIARGESASIDSAAVALADSYSSGRGIYVFGCTHSAIPAEDVFYRAGAPCFWRPLWGPGMNISQTPGFLTSAAEHNEMLGTDIVRCSRLGKGDFLVVLSTSGKNAAPVAVAVTAMELGVKVVAVSSSAYRERTGNHSRYASLWKIPGLPVIDNHVPEGDSSVAAAGGIPMGPLSTIAASFILHTLSARAVEILKERGVDAPVFRSSNAPGGREYNEALLKDESVREAFLLP